MCNQGILSVNYCLLYTLGAVAIVNAHFGSGTGSLLLNILGCTGTEANLLSCYHRGIGVVGSNCTHSGDVGVRCQGIVILS